MPTIRQVDSEYDIEIVQDLFWKYLQWANSRNYEEFGIKLDITAMLKDNMDKIEIISTPNGRLLLAFDGAAVAGLACMSKMREEIGGIKRMYVLPSFRGRGIGRELLDDLIEEARSIGYSRIRLDSARYMKEAHSLYRSVGFKEIDEFPESEIPEEFRAHWIFMEKHL
jgi:GNAT superfamily N-acetyltransferase